MSDIKALVDDLINKNKIMVFSKSYCPFCSKAKKALTAETSNFQVLELDGRDDMDQIQDYLASITGARSVPRVFINGKCIGGGSETEDLQKSGQLKTMVN